MVFKKYPKYGLTASCISYFIPTFMYLMPKKSLYKKIPKGFGIFSKRLVRTRSCATALFLCPWKNLGA